LKEIKLSRGKVAQSENLRNRKTSPKGSNYKGVYPIKGTNKYKIIFNIGPFDNQEQAAQIYDGIVKQFNGEVAFTNFK